MSVEKGAKKPTVKKSKKRKTVKATAKPKNKGGRPSKFGRVKLYQVKMLYNKGWIDEEVADFYNVSVQTLNNWKKKHPKFFESITEAKDNANKVVEKALFERATGFTVPATKVFCHKGKIIEHEVMEHYPPDYNSMELFLTNRDPKRWRKKVDVTSDGEKVAGVSLFTVPEFANQVLVNGKPVDSNNAGKSQAQKDDITPMIQKVEGNV